MALKIEDWGKILLEHYEKNPDSFYISLEDILSGAKLYDPAFVSRLTDSIKERGSGYTVDEHLTRTFARALCPMRQQMDTHDIAESLRNAWFNGPEGQIYASLRCLFVHVKPIQKAYVQIITTNV